MSDKLLILLPTYLKSLLWMGVFRSQTMSAEEINGAMQGLRGSQDDNPSNVWDQRTPFVFDRMDQLVIKDNFLFLTDKSQISLHQLLLSLPLMITSSSSLKQCLYAAISMTKHSQSASIISDSHRHGKMSDWRRKVVTCTHVDLKLAYDNEKRKHSHQLVLIGS